MSRPTPEQWKRDSGMSGSYSYNPDEYPSGVDTPLTMGGVENEDGMAYLRSMSYVHHPSSGRYSPYSLADSHRNSAHNTLVNASLTPTDYASSDAGSQKGGKIGNTSPKKSPLKSSSSWEAQAAELGAIPDALTAEAQKKMKYGRLKYIDGLRFLAAVVVLTSTVISNTSKTWGVGSSILYPFNSFFALTLFLTIQGRALPLPWLISRKDSTAAFNEAAARAKKAKATKPAAVAKTLDEKATVPPVQPSSASCVAEDHSEGKYNFSDFKLVGMAMIFRPFRFVLPILFATGLQYGVCKATGLYPNNPNFANLIGVAPSWCYSNATQWIITATNLFTSEDMADQLISQVGPLFYMPWFFQNSHYLYGATLIVNIFHKDTRVFFLVVMAFLNWTTLSYLAPAMLGLLVAELEVSGYFARLRKVTWAKWVVQILCAVAFFVLLLVPVIRDHINEGLSHLQVIRPTNRGAANIYGVIKFTDVICSTLLLVLLELSPIMQRVLSVAPLSMMGQQLSAAIVAVHSIVLWGIMPKVFPMVEMTSFTTHAAANLAGIWALTLVITLGLSTLFRALIEIPSELLGRATLIFFYGQEDMQQLSSVSLKQVEKARYAGYLLPLPSLGNPMAKLGLTKIPW